MGILDGATFRFFGGPAALVSDVDHLMPVAISALPATLRYAGGAGVAKWEGYVVEDEELFRAFIRGPVAARSDDTEVQTEFADELRALATTGHATEFLESFLSSVPQDRNWEIGEAIAETVLAEDDNREVVWPWNERRDRRTPQASLPGADLVGFCRDANGFALLLGEVKTSADASTPPNVMYGTSGMTWQLENSAGSLSIQHALIRWLCLRCTTEGLKAAYREALRRYVNSEGKDMFIVGVLLRDTGCDERDVASRAQHLGGLLVGPTRVEVMAWYLPIPIRDWRATLRGRR